MRVAHHGHACTRRDRLGGGPHRTPRSVTNTTRMAWDATSGTGRCLSRRFCLGCSPNVGRRNRSRSNVAQRVTSSESWTLGASRRLDSRFPTISLETALSANEDPARSASILPGDCRGARIVRGHAPSRYARRKDRHQWCESQKHLASSVVVPPSIVVGGARGAAAYQYRRHCFGNAVTVWQSRPYWARGFGCLTLLVRIDLTGRHAPGVPQEPGRWARS